MSILFEKASTIPDRRPAKHVGDPFDVPTPFVIDPSLNEDDGNPRDAWVEMELGSQVSEGMSLEKSWTIWAGCLVRE